MTKKLIVFSLSISFSLYMISSSNYCITHMETIVIHLICKCHMYMSKAEGPDHLKLNGSFAQMRKDLENSRLQRVIASPLFFCVNPLFWISHTLISFNCRMILRPDAAWVRGKDWTELWRLLMATEVLIEMPRIKFVFCRRRMRRWERN